MAGVWIRRQPVQEPTDASEMSPPRFDCPVCLENLPDSSSYSTSCGHKLCRQCAQKCLQTSVACPICRHLMLNEKAQQGFPASKLLGLFILNPSFFAVPGSTVLLRVFEPRYLILIKRCIQQDALFGLQAGFKARRGVLVSIKRHRELPEGHIIMEGLVVARYEAFDQNSQPVEEPDTFGLYQMKSKILVDSPVEASADMARRCEELLQARMADLSRYDREVISKICGPCPSPATYEFSFWVLGALFSPQPKADVLFSPSVAERMAFCLRLLEEDQPFECLMGEH